MEKSDLPTAVATFSSHTSGHYFISRMVPPFIGNKNYHYFPQPQKITMVQYHLLKKVVTFPQQVDSLSNFILLHSTFLETYLLQLSSPPATTIGNNSN